MKKLLIVLFLVVLSSFVYADWVKISSSNSTSGGVTVVNNIFNCNGTQCLSYVFNQPLYNVSEQVYFNTTYYNYLNSSTADILYYSILNPYGFKNMTRLNEVDNPNASKVFNMGGNTVTWLFTNPVGGMKWNLTGGWSGHILEIHDDSPVPTGIDGDHLLHVESDRLNVVPAHFMQLAGRTSLEVTGNIQNNGDINVTGNATITNLTITSNGGNTTIKIPTGNSLLVTDDSMPFVEFTQGDQIKILSGGSIVYPDGTTQNTEEQVIRQSNNRNSSNDSTITGFWNTTDFNFNVQANKNYTLLCDIKFISNATATGMTIALNSTITTSYVETIYQTWSTAVAPVTLASTTFNSAMVGTGSGSPVLPLISRVMSSFGTTSAGWVNLSFKGEVTTAGTWTSLRRGSQCILYTFS